MKVSHQQNDLLEEQGRGWRQTAEKKAAARSENPRFMFGFQLMEAVVQRTSGYFSKSKTFT